MSDDNQENVNVAEIMKEIRDAALEHQLEKDQIPPESTGSTEQGLVLSEHAENIRKALEQSNLAFQQLQQEQLKINSSLEFRPTYWNRLSRKLSNRFGNLTIHQNDNFLKKVSKKFLSGFTRLFFGNQIQSNQQMQTWLDQLALMNAGLIGTLNSTLPYIQFLENSSDKLQNHFDHLRNKLKKDIEDFDQKISVFENYSKDVNVRLDTYGTAISDLNNEVQKIPPDPKDIVESIYQTFDELKQEITSSTVDLDGKGIEREARLKKLLNDGSDIEDFNFLEWEGETRGAEVEISQQQDHYSTFYIGHQDVLDIGCGRGEFLEILKKRDISASGVDMDLSMIRHCQEKGLNVKLANGIDFITELENDSLGGIFAAQVVEHLTVSEISKLCRQAFRVLKPGAPITLETQNPMCLTIFSGAFFSDPTHVKPVHPNTLKFFLENAGFVFSDIHYSAPVPETDKLELLDSEQFEGFKELIEKLNANFSKLNSVMYTYAHYAVLAHKPEKD